MFIVYVLVGVVLVNNRGLLANSDTNGNSDGISPTHSSIAGKKNYELLSIHCLIYLIYFN